MKKERERGKPIQPRDPIEDPGALNKRVSAGGVRLNEGGMDPDTQAPRTSRRRGEQPAQHGRGDR
jgi:hypothetical protein